MRGMNSLAGPRTLRVTFAVVLLALSFARVMFHLQVLDSPLVRIAFLVGWGGWALVLLRAGGAETDPEWRRYDRGAAIFAIGVLAFDLGWPDGWSYLRPGQVAGAVASGLFGTALWMKGTSGSGADADREVGTSTPAEPFDRREP
jgi:hypothetical protein